MLAWIPSEPGRKFPYGNIPISILSKMREVDNRKNSMHSPKVRKPHSPGELCVNSGRQDVYVNVAIQHGSDAHRESRDDNASKPVTSPSTDPEESLSESLSWSASPPERGKRELPPDSSALFQQSPLLQKGTGLQRRNFDDVDADKYNKERLKKQRQTNTSDSGSDLEMVLPNELKNKNNNKNTVDVSANEDDGTIEKAFNGPIAMKDSANVTGTSPLDKSTPKKNLSTIIPDTPFALLQRNKELKPVKSSSGKHGLLIGTDRKNEGNSPSYGYEDESTVQKSVSSEDEIQSTGTGNDVERGQYSSTCKIQKRNNDFLTEATSQKKKMKLEHSAIDLLEKLSSVTNTAQGSHKTEEKYLRTLVATKENDSSAKVTMASLNTLEDAALGSSHSYRKQATSYQLPRPSTADMDEPSSLQSRHASTEMAAIVRPSNDSRGGEMVMNTHNSGTSHRNTPISTARSRPDLRPSRLVMSHPNLVALDNEVYTNFRETYTDYKGNLKHFLGICRMIYKTQMSNNSLHWTSWDDFVVRHSTEYKPFLINCAYEGEEVITYEQYYRDWVEEPFHKMQVLTPSTLQKVLSASIESPSSASYTSAVSVPLDDRMFDYSLANQNKRSHEPSSLHDHNDELNKHATLPKEKPKRETKYSSANNVINANLESPASQNSIPSSTSRKACHITSHFESRYDERQGGYIHNLSTRNPATSRSPAASSPLNSNKNGKVLPKAKQDRSLCSASGTKEGERQERRSKPPIFPLSNIAKSTSTLSTSQLLVYNLIFLN